MSRNIWQRLAVGAVIALALIMPAYLSADVYLEPSEYGDIVIDLGSVDVVWGVAYSCQYLYADPVADTIYFQHDDRLESLTLASEQSLTVTVSAFSLSEKHSDALAISIDGSGAYTLSVAVHGALQREYYQVVKNGAMNIIGSTSQGDLRFSVESSDDQAVRVQFTEPSRLPVDIYITDIGNGQYRFDYSFRDADILVERVSWNFGDGHGSTRPTPAHSYDVPGTYVVTALIYDDGGLVGWGSREVSVSADGSVSIIDASPLVSINAVIAVGIALGSVAVAGLYTYVADRQYGGANRMLSIMVVVLGVILAILYIREYGGL